MKNLFITHLYRQGNGDIIQLLSNIHNAVSNNAYILFDNSFTRDGIKRPFSYEEQFAVLENQIKKIIFWNEVFLDNAPAVNIIYKGRIINSKKHFEFLTDNNKLFDVATLTKIDLNTEQCKVTYQEDWINFVKKHNMSKEEYNSFVQESKKHRLSLDDIYMLVNKQRAAKNTADATKKDMLGQMKAVRDIPTSAGDSNSQPAVNNPDEVIFNALAGLDGDVDDLFGGK